MEESVVLPLRGIPAGGGGSSGISPRPASPRARGSMQGPFLDRVKRNDVDGARAFARGGKTADRGARDELGRTALVVAVDEGDCDMIQCLIELQHDAGEALFHAVSVQNAAAVATICRSLSELGKLHIINSFPSDHHYPVVTTPLLLAGKTNNFEMIETLLRHGAELPDLNDLMFRAGGDPYLKFLALVNWYEAASSEAYILLTSSDPLDAIFQLGRSLRAAEETLNVPLFNAECERIERKLAASSAKLLGLARDKGEIGALLRGGEAGSPDPRVPLRIQQAMEIDSFKQFVCHPSSQAYMLDLWDIPHPCCLAKRSRFVYPYLFNVAVVLLFPVLCGAYILFPWKTAGFMKRPKIRFLVHAGSRLGLLCILIWSTRSWIVELLVTTDFDKVNISDQEVIDLYISSITRPLTPVSMLILLWIAGMTVRTVKQLWGQGVAYFGNGWNVMDFVQLILYWIFVIAGTVAFLQSLRIAESEGIFDRLPDIEQALSGENTSRQATGTVTVSAGATDGSTAVPGSRHTWQDFRAQLVSEGAFAVANVLSFLQILHHLLAFALLGPLLVSFIGMAHDVLKFFAIFGCLLVSFSIGLTQLYHKFQALDVRRTCSREAGACGETPFLNFSQSMVSLFWSLFDMVDPGSLRVEDSLVFTNTVGSAMYAAFMLVGCIVLLNALIAMMSNTYTRVEENSEVEWKLARTKIMVEYINEKASLPPPFNLVPTVKFVLWLCRCIYRKCCRHSGCPCASKRFDATDQDRHKAEYKEVSRVLGERCLRAMNMERRVESQTTSDLKVLKNSVERVSCEMLEIRRNLTDLLGVLHPAKGAAAKTVDHRAAREA